MKLVARLNNDEQAVIDFITSRLLRGREVYGPLDIASDTRDWTKEAREEAADLLVYLAIRFLRETR